MLTRSWPNSNILEKRLPQLLLPVADPLETIHDNENRRRVSLVDEEGGRVFTRHAEATWPELFFDIFFVANLTTFTAAQEIDDPDCMYEYSYLPALYI